MKKIIIILSIIIVVLFTNNTSKMDDVIRVRVLANSNTEHDQNIKRNISKDISKEMYNILKDIDDVTIARREINNNLDLINTIIKKDLENEQYSYDINYGLNYFPEKEYNNTVYEEGNYESLLITLGEGKGDNWWCILFPPLCLIEAEESNEEIEYSFFLEELFDKIF